MSTTDAYVVDKVKNIGVYRGPKQRQQQPKSPVHRLPLIPPESNSNVAIKITNTTENTFTAIAIPRTRAIAPRIFTRHPHRNDFTSSKLISNNDELRRDEIVADKFLLINGSLLNDVLDDDIKTVTVFPSVDSVISNEEDGSRSKQTARTPVAAVLSPLEAWCLTRMDQWYATSQSVKCPFLRRRSGDMLDNVEWLLNQFVIRPECRQVKQAHRPAGTNKKQNTKKYRHLSMDRLRQYIYEDWVKADTGNKGYYITGKLTTGVYRDDCLFLGPDPDMPIHGTRKYVGVASHLFDYTVSEAVLHSLKVVPVDELPSRRLRPATMHDIKLRRQQQQHEQSKTGGISNKTCLVADWTLSGILRLPWKPSLPTFSGQTIYHLDNDGLIICHEESWDCSAIHAFCHTLLPDLAGMIWQKQKQKER
jgi:hypothetical protein